MYQKLSAKPGSAADRSQLLCLIKNKLELAQWESKQNLINLIDREIDLTSR